MSAIPSGAMRVVGAERRKIINAFERARGEVQRGSRGLLLDKNKWTERNRSDIHTFITPNRTPLIHK